MVAPACCHRGDVLRCALALARNESEARRILLTRLSGFEHDKLGGHTGGNLLLSMMEQYSGDFLAAVDGPIVLVTNLLTERRGITGFTAGAAASRIGEAIGRPVDVVIVNAGYPSEETLDRYAGEHKQPLPVGDVPDGCEVTTGEFWQGAFARHTRRRLAYAVWGVLSQRLLG